MWALRECNLPLTSNFVAALEPSNTPSYRVYLVCGSACHNTLRCWALYTHLYGVGWPARPLPMSAPLAPTIWM